MRGAFNNSYRLYVSIFGTKINTAYKHGLVSCTGVCRFIGSQGCFLKKGQSPNFKIDRFLSK